MKIVIVSHGRAGRVTTDALLEGYGDAVICVPEAQRADYEAAGYDAEIVCHPDSVIGLAPKRQWIMDEWNDVLMLDDDIARFTDISVIPGEPSEVRGDRLVAWLWQIHDAADQLGIPMWGLDGGANPMVYQGHDPFRLTGMCFACVLGLNRAHGQLDFHPNTVTAEAEYLSLMNQYKYRIVLVDERLRFTVKDTFSSLGGNAGNRTAGTFLRDVAFVQSVFGEDSISLQRKDGEIVGYKAHFVL